MYSSRRYYFLTVAETRNVTHAAQILMISQPSLTQYINKLEKELNVQLLDRRYSPIRLTKAGQIYYEYLKKAFSDDQKLFSDLEQVRGNKNTLNVGLPMQRSREVNQLLLRPFAIENPDIPITMWEGTSKEVLENLLQGEIDIGFCHIGDLKLAGCDVFPVSKENIVIVCSRKNPILKMETSRTFPMSVSAELLNTQCYYQMADGYLLKDLAEQYLSRNHVTPYRRFIMSDVISIIDTVCKYEDNGFAFVADYFFDDPYLKDRLPELAFLRLGDSDIEWYFALVRKASSIHSREERLFWNQAIKVCSKSK